jgi:hypothetical protein
MRVALSGSQDTSNGELQLEGLSGDTTTGSTWGYYPIDGSRTLAIEVDGQQLKLLQAGLPLGLPGIHYLGS